MRPGHPSTGLPEGASLTAQGRIPEIKIGSHVPAFVRERLETSSGSSLAAGELHVAYEAWCGTHDHKPLSMPKFAAELKALGYASGRAAALSAIAVCGLQPSSKRVHQDPSTMRSE